MHGVNDSVDINDVNINIVIPPHKKRYHKGVKFFFNINLYKTGLFFIKFIETIRHKQKVI